MARPRKNGMDYFPHDTDASSDEKIEAMRSLFGNDAYAFYFILCERIYRTSNAELDLSKPVIFQSIIKKLMVTAEKFDEMLQAAFDLELFIREEFEQNRLITSNGIKRRFDEVVNMRKRWRDKKDNNDDEVFPEENTGDNAEETGESKAKESKENKSKENKIKYADFVSMYEPEYQKLIDQYGPELVKRMVSVLDNYKGSKGKKYKSDYRAILSWVADKVQAEQPKPRGQPIDRSVLDELSGE